MNALASIESGFIDYTGRIINLDGTNKDNYILKKEHSYRVRNLMRMIGESEQLATSEKELGEIIGSLHDIGRFKQYFEFKSFSDAMTGRHALKSIHVIEELNMIHELSNKDQSIIKNAVRYHDLIQLPIIHDDRLLMFSRMIRDADKLDALYAEANNENETRKYTLDVLSDERDFSDEVMKDILSKRQVDFSKFRYRLDRRLGILGLIFDINFSESFRVIHKSNYIEKLLEPFKDNRGKVQMYHACKDYIEGHIS